MNSFASLCSTLCIVATIQGGSGGTLPVKDGAWGSPLGWNGGLGQSNNQMVETVEATGQVGVSGGQISFTEFSSNPSNPGYVYVISGSGGTAQQNGSNNQQSTSSGDSSAGYSGNTVENIGNSGNYIAVVGEGDALHVVNVADAAVAGYGVVGQASDIEAEAGGLGWKKN